MAFKETRILTTVLWMLRFIFEGIFKKIILLFPSICTWGGIVGTWVQGLQSPEASIASSGAGVTGGCGPLNMDAGD